MNNGLKKLDWFYAYYVSRYPIRISTAWNLVRLVCVVRLMSNPIGSTWLFRYGNRTRLKPLQTTHCFWMVVFHRGITESITLLINHQHFLCHIPAMIVFIIKLTTWKIIIFVRQQQINILIFINIQGAYHRSSAYNHRSMLITLILQHYQYRSSTENIPGILL